MNISSSSGQHFECQEQLLGVSYPENVVGYRSAEICRTCLYDTLSLWRPEEDPRGGIRNVADDVASG